MNKESDSIRASSELDVLWSQVLDSMRSELNTASFKTWFEHTAPLDINDAGEFLVGVQNEFARSWLAGRYTPRLTAAVRALTGLDLTVRIVVDPSLAAQAAPAPEVVDATPVPVEVSEPGGDLGPLSTSGFNPKYTFDTFVVSDSNVFARNAALAVAETPGLRYNPLFIWGDSGLGKTHLLQAIGNYVVQNLPHKKVVYVTSEQFTNEFLRCLKAGTVDDFRHRYRTADVLLIDDIQFLENKISTQDQFFHTFNELQQHGKAVALASDRPPKSINMDDRYRSRFTSGLPADIQPPNYETRLAILQQYIENLGSSFDDDALFYLAEKSTPNIREMEGAVNRCTAVRDLSRKSKVDLSIVQQVVQDLFPDQAKKVISISTIQKEVCRHYGISNAEIIGSKRSQAIVFPRQVAMFLARELTDLSLPAIGREFGGRDHTTVLHAQAKIQKLMRSQRDIYNEIHQLTNSINNRT